MPSRLDEAAPRRRAHAYSTRTRALHGRTDAPRTAHRTACGAAVRGVTYGCSLQHIWLQAAQLCEAFEQDVPDAPEVR